MPRRRKDNANLGGVGIISRRGRYAAATASADY